MKIWRKKELFEKLWDDDEIWNDFVGQWIEKYTDAVYDLINDTLASEIDESGWNQTKEEYAEFVDEKLEAEVSQAEEHADQAYKEMRIEKAISKIEKEIK